MRNKFTQQHTDLPGGGELNWRDDKDDQDCRSATQEDKPTQNQLFLQGNEDKHVRETLVQECYFIKIWHNMPW